MRQKYETAKILMEGTGLFCVADWNIGPRESWVFNNHPYGATDTQWYLVKCAISRKLAYILCVLFSEHPYLQCWDQVGKVYDFTSMTCCYCQRSWHSEWNLGGLKW